MWRHRDKDADMFDKLESNTSSNLSETARASRDKLSSSVRCGRQRDGLLIGSEGRVSAAFDARVTVFPCVGLLCVGVSESVRKMQYRV